MSSWCTHNAKYKNIQYLNFVYHEVMTPTPQLGITTLATRSTTNHLTNGKSVGFDHWTLSLGDLGFEIVEKSCQLAASEPASEFFALINHFYFGKMKKLIVRQGVSWNKGTFHLLILPPLLSPSFSAHLILVCHVDASLASSLRTHIITTECVVISVQFVCTVPQPHYLALCGRLHAHIDSDANANLSGFTRR